MLSSHSPLGSLIASRTNFSFLFMFVSLVVDLYSIASYVHPFMLADNRHYVFYIWRYLYRSHWAMPMILVPLYLTQGWLIWQMLMEQGDNRFFEVLLWGLATALALIPSPLLECRYFILPFVFLRLHLATQSERALSRETILYLFMNLVTCGVFLGHSFEWPHQAGEVMRFMW